MMPDYMEFDNNPNKEKSDNFFYEYGKYRIPDYMVGGIKKYLRYGIKPGSFLYAVLSNNFVNAVAYADKDNIDNLPAYAYWMMNILPREAWGSEEKVEKWIRMGGFKGLESKDEVHALKKALLAKLERIWDNNLLSGGDFRNLRLKIESSKYLETLKSYQNDIDKFFERLKIKEKGENK